MPWLRTDAIFQLAVINSIRRIRHCQTFSLIDKAPRRQNDKTTLQERAGQEIQRVSKLVVIRNQLT